MDAERRRCGARVMGGTFGCLVTVVIGLTGCREQVFEPVRDGLVTTATMSGRVRVTTKADLLFVVDNSVSMRNEQDKLAAAFPELVDGLATLDPPVAYRVGVMTTSVEERFGPCDASLPGGPEQCSADFGGGPFQCIANACVRTFDAEAGLLVAAPGNPLVLDSDALPPSEIARLFAENVRAAGLGGSRQEQPLRALSLAFSSGALDAFWRPDARLVVLIASDEDDCSDSTSTLVSNELVGSEVKDRCEEASRTDDGRLDPVDAWVRTFRTLPVDGGTREVALGGIVSLATGSQNPGLCRDEDCVARCEEPTNGIRKCENQCAGSLREERCIEECVAECASFCGAQTPSRRLARAVRQMSGPLASICESSYAPALANLAAVLGIPERLELPSQPNDDRTVFFEVTRNGRVIRCVEGSDYTIDRTTTPATLVIHPNGACRLLPDDEWSLRYLAR